MKLLKFPTPEPTDFAGALKALAASIEADEFGDVVTLAVIIEGRETITLQLNGADTDPIRVLGLFEASKMVLVNGE